VRVRKLGGLGPGTTGSFFLLDAALPTLQPNSPPHPDVTDSRPGTTGSGRNSSSDSSSANGSLSGIATGSASPATSLGSHATPTNRTAGICVANNRSSFASSSGFNQTLALPMLLPSTLRGEAQSIPEEYFDINSYTQGTNDAVWQAGSAIYPSISSSEVNDWASLGLMALRSSATGGGTDEERFA